MVGQYTCDEDVDFMINHFYDDWPATQSAGESSAEGMEMPNAMDMTFQQALDQSNRQMETLRFEARRMAILEARMATRDRHSISTPRRVRRRVSLL